MRKTAPASPADPTAARVAVLERVKARRPEGKTRTYPNVDGGPPAILRIPADSDRLPPNDLQQWIDDRVVACFGGRVRLNDGEQCAFTILESMRGGDAKAVRETVKRAGEGLDGQVRYLVAGVLATWRGGAPTFALDVVIAALGEARRLGWDRPPRRQNRAPGLISQIPGEMVA